MNVPGLRDRNLPRDKVSKIFKSFPDWLGFLGPPVSKVYNVPFYRSGTESISGAVH